MRWFLCILIVVALGLVSPSSNAASPKQWESAIKAFLKWLDGPAIKQADELPTTSGQRLNKPDELPSTGNKSLNKADEWLALDKSLVTRTLARASHNRTCPAMRLRVSLPQLNVLITVPSALNVRSGPGTNHEKKGKFTKGGGKRSASPTLRPSF